MSLFLNSLMCPKKSSLQNYRWIHPCFLKFYNYKYVEQGSLLISSGRPRPVDFYFIMSLITTGLVIGIIFIFVSSTATVLVYKTQKWLLTILPRPHFYCHRLGLGALCAWNIIKNYWIFFLYTWLNVWLPLPKKKKKEKIILLISLTW